MLHWIALFAPGPPGRPQTSSCFSTHLPPAQLADSNPSMAAELRYLPEQKIERTLGIGLADQHLAEIVDEFDDNQPVDTRTNSTATSAANSTTNSTANSATNSTAVCTSSIDRMVEWRLQDEHESVLHFLSCFETYFRASPDPPRIASWFYCFSRPNVSIRQYLQCIARTLKIQPTVFLHALIYINRVVRMTRGKIPFCILTMHRLCLTATLVAAKYVDDNHYSNVSFAKVGGTTLTEINEAEIEFLFAIKFNLGVSEGEIQRCNQFLLKHSSSQPRKPNSSPIPEHPERLF
ncbi:hypothetical protein AAMO2058_000517500 [Amorphochlora amoebiformis]